MRLGRARSSSSELRKLRVPLAGLEPAASRVGTVHSDPLSYRGKINKKRSRQDSNLRPHGSQPCALIQLSYGTRTDKEVDSPGFEPGSLGCKPRILPLNYEPIEAAGGTRTRIVLSGAQVPHLSATAAKTYVGTARALGRVRTGDPLFTKPVLFQLSYQGGRVAGRQGIEPCRAGFGVRTASKAAACEERSGRESNPVHTVDGRAAIQSHPGAGESGRPELNRDLSLIRRVLYQ